VIGAGAIGLASAVCLARRGLTDVVVVEATHVAAGSSGLSVGIVETQYFDPLDIELRVRSMAFFEELERHHGLAIVRNGYLRLARGEEGMRAAERSVQVQHELGTTDATVLDRDEIAALIPDMRCDDIAGGLFGPGDGFLDGHLYCGLLAEWGAELGVELQAGQRVTGAEIGADGRHRLLTERGLEIACEVVVNAAGPWAQRVAQIVGGTMNLVPQRQQATMVSISRELDYVMPSVMDYTPRSGEVGLYFRHERPDRLIAGLHSEEVSGGVSDPDHYPRSPDQDFLEVVAEKLLHRLPGFPDAGLGGGWAGLYPVSIDGLPQVGPNHDLESVVNAGGAGGSGIQLSPVIGELVADWIIEGRPSAVNDAERLLPGRPAAMAGPHADKEEAEQ
jgi:sarcosine oxidase subunit beta